MLKLSIQTPNLCDGKLRIFISVSHTSLFDRDASLLIHANNAAWPHRIFPAEKMFHVHAALPNGHAELLSLLPSSTVQELRTTAQGAFGRKFLRLITAKNRVLVDPDETLEEAEIEDGECLTALVLQPQLAATERAFALWCHGDSAIVTWGDADRGGDSAAVRDQLRGVQQIQATGFAFAALLADGSVVTWGSEHFGGDSSAVQHQLRVCSRFRPLIWPLLPFWQMDPS